MDYIIKEDKILIYDLNNFNAQHIMECGQIFTYEKLSDNSYMVYSKDKKCEVITHEKHVEILTHDPLYFEVFFDLKTNYSQIKQQILALNPNLKNMVDFGSGIRILNQDIFETTIGFIISANNNIKRIMNSMKYLRKHAGTVVNGYNAFPTLQQLEKLDQQFFVQAGLGYRAKQIVKALQNLKQLQPENLKNLPSDALRQKLLTVNGIGGKVADCVLLFAYGKKDVFPVDTWIEKVYVDLFDKQEKKQGKNAPKLG